MGKSPFPCCNRKDADIIGLTSDFTIRIEARDLEIKQLGRQLHYMKLANDQQYQAASEVREEAEKLTDEAEEYEDKLYDLEEKNRVLTVANGNMNKNMASQTDLVVELYEELATLKHIVQNPVAMHNQITALTNAVTDRVNPFKAGMDADDNMALTDEVERLNLKLRDEKNNVMRLEAYSKGLEYRLNFDMGKIGDKSRCRRND